MVAIAVGTTTIARANDAPPAKGEPFDIIKLMMESTIRIEGQGGSTGTAFLLLEKDYLPILVTAAHVLDRMPGTEVDLTMRARTQEGWTRTNVALPIRRGRTPIYVRHLQADVAAMYITVDPKALPAQMMMPEGLVEDETLKEQGVRTGQEAFVMSYPLGVLSNDEGFPILKSGHIATYPMYPTRDRRAFALDCDLNEGEYGAPVIVRLPTEVGEDRTLKQREQNGLGFVIGLVGRPPETTSKVRVLTVIPATLIIDTIELLRKSNARQLKSEEIQRSDREPCAPVGREIGSLPPG